jgi:hypothetical protein
MSSDANQPDDPQTVLRAYFEGVGPFSERAELIGMAGSMAPSLFSEYFDNLTASSQNAVADELSAVALGERSDLQAFEMEAAQLMYYICFGEHWQIFRRQTSKIQRTIADVTGRRDWHYLLSLWGILALLGSPSTQELAQQLRETVHDDEFTDALARSQDVLRELQADRCEHPWK